ncbi:PAS domain-containing protein [Candidatus Mycobacterium wuenschmannii]|uniref:PAS domain-containing protein n=1 Tax=Candidatus Mycobacterium wuenschmannii TaxID=3027808 RepID=A0ABY8W1A5_9MYCO|nr:PAS domain-containing protein [Candidatus Mycobacterium wuenschmannii]WIM89670.1 PAS domain-containing protein [Candidatus Mycobacterium wuenschmannii]
MSSQSASLAADQRQGRPRGESATEFLRDFPALLALSRLPVPILAVDDSGAIEFANNAFASMVGHSREELLVMSAQSLVDCYTPAHSGMVATLREYANTVIRLRHADGWTMPALVSDSVLIRDDESLAVVALTDLSEIAWHTSPDDMLLPG